MIFQKFSLSNACFFCKLTRVRIEKYHLSAAPSACDFQKVYLRSIPCCNTCQVNLFLIQQFDQIFIFSSSPKVGIGSINYHRFGSRCQTLQCNPRSCYMQTRWPTHPTICSAVRLYAGSQLPVF